MSFENALLDYGLSGLFIAYLIYDRQVIISKLKNSIDALTDAIKFNNKEN
jgi:hypothetical protein